MAKRIIWLAILTIMFSKSGNAQSDFQLYNQSLSPHQLIVNPSYLPDAEFFIGLPGISNTSLGFSNNSFKYRDLIKQKPGTDSIYFDFQDYLSALRKNNFIYAGGSSDIFSIGWREGRWYVSGRITENVGMRLRFGKELMQVAINGNAPYAGTNLPLGDIFLQASHYRKYAVSLSRDIACRLRVGATISYLYGMESVDIQRSNITLNTDPVTFDLTGSSDILINTSGTKGYSKDSLSSWSYLFQRPNRGYSLDLGAQYKVDESLTVFGSILDMGRIHWKSKPINYQNTVDAYSYTGIQLNQFLGNSGDSLKSGVQKYLDSLSNVFSIKETNNSYTTRLPSRFYLGGKYVLKNNNTFQLLYFGNTFRGKLYSSVSTAFTKRFSELFEMSVNWALHNNSVSNIGAGFTLNLGLTQFSLMSDHLPGLFTQSNSRGTNIRIGITLVSGYDQKRPDFCDKDNDGVPNIRDECPTDPGPISLNGCPDSDGDGIINRYDECPLEPGSTILKGCPDSDGDLIIDKLDRCPTEAGLLALKGCPDGDEDGIADIDDACPNIPGLAKYKGCPDRDGDSIPDNEDICPDIAGPKEFSGCPDSDGDGISDDNDECPQTPGPKEFQGCPDSDADGISDQNDRCPLIVGTKANRGCPLEDRDGDGIPDEKDRCPLVPGNISNQGCPDVANEASIIVTSAFNNLEFESGNAILKQKSFASLNKLAALLHSNPELHLLVAGHTDNVGNPAKNMSLSRDRAKAVASFLINSGINENRLEIEWFGQSKPLASNDTEAGKKKNRRVELTLIFE
jgi:outer membrane protein OmpA-like peptidoglycan-associated protein